MRVCFVYKEDYPWDIRVEKLLHFFRDEGHPISLVCRNLKNLPRREQAEGIDIWRLPSFAGLGKLGSLMSVPFFLHPIWFFGILNAVRRSHSELIVVRDLPLMPTALAVGRLTGTKVLFDMAECYPEMYASTLQYSGNSLAKRIVKNPGFAAFLEKFCVDRADMTFVMIEESQDRLVARGCDPARIRIVSNTPPRVERPVLDGGTADVMRIFYVGFITRIRGIDNALHGLRAYLDRPGEKPRVIMDLIGKGAATEEFKRLARELDLEDHVNFRGWCSHEEVAESFAASDVGLLSYHVCSHWNHTIPNKLFDYMVAGMPVLATDVIPIQRIVHETDCGVICRDNDPESFADALAELSDPDRRRQLSTNGYEAVERKYNWTEDCGRIRAVMESWTNEDSA